MSIYDLHEYMVSYEEKTVLPCPTCGGKPDFLMAPGGIIYGMRSAVCFKCEKIFVRKSLAEACEAWNKAAGPTPGGAA